MFKASFEIIYFFNSPGQFIILFFTSFALTFKLMISDYFNSDKIMSAKDYEEEWEEINDDSSFVARVKSSIIGTDEENMFDSYDYYKVKDTFDKNKFHYVVRIYAGKNGCGEWSSYLTDMKTIFDNLINKPECHFSKAWLIEWKNSCANDTSAALIGLRD